jgi:hypothetical protein
MTQWNIKRIADRIDADPTLEVPEGEVPSLFPIADFAYTKPGGNTAQFEDLSSDPDGAIVGWRWEFGDVVARPVASFRITTNGLQVTATDQSVTPAGTTITNWVYTWGDGTQTSGQQNPTHTYPAGGSYDITLTVTASNGQVSSNTNRLNLTLGGLGIPFGPYTIWETSSSLLPYHEPFSWNYGGTDAARIVTTLNAARNLHRRTSFNLAGGSHDKYKTNGVFDRAKWNAKIDTYNTPAIRSAIASAVADGTLTFCNVIDEPANTSPDNSWGPAGTLDKAKVDSMASYIKNIFPTLPLSVTLDWRIWNTQSFHVIDIQLSQYRNFKGDVIEYRDGALALGQRDGHQIAFSLNILDGGIRWSGSGWQCPLSTTGGFGTYAPNCKMTADQMEDWGITLGSAGVALAMWDYREDFMADPENRTAWFAVRAHLDTLPRRSFRRFG